MAGSLTAVCYALAAGAAQVVRVHDVRETRDAVLLWRTLDEFQKKPQSGAGNCQ
jgi:dihydropteroate synthase